MRIDTQLLHPPVGGAAIDRHLAIGPEDPPPQRALEDLDGLHRHGEHHLLVEARIALGRRQAVLRQDMGMVEVQRLVELPAGGVDVDDFQVFVGRPGSHRRLPARLPGDLDGGVADLCRFHQRRGLRIERIDPQLAHRRCRIV
ncbi:hypothetical protein D9M71_355420 [compost metagenome]